jgi:clan AA aspartic protease (TIGR02281 family)
MLFPRLPRYASGVRWLPLWAVLLGPAVDHSAIAGQMYRWVDERGGVHLTDTPPPMQGDRRDVKVYAPSPPTRAPEGPSAPAAERGRASLIPGHPGGAIVVEAVLNRRLTVPMVLDTGADITVLTKPVAQELRLLGGQRLPSLEFRTPGGVITVPVATLPSLRVGTAEARDVAVAIDIGEHLPIGLLGMSFLRHFKVTVDRQRGLVAFER